MEDGFSGRETGRRAATRNRLTPPGQLGDAMIAAIIKRLEAGKPVRRRLPSNGYLHLDRQVPFLLVYRRPQDEADPAIEQLLKGEASYLIADGRRRFNKSVVALIGAIAESLSGSYGAFLIIEIWAGDDSDFANITPSYRPAFNVLAEKGGDLGATVQTLKKALGRIRAQRAAAHVELSESRHPWAPGLSRLLPAAMAKRLNCHSLGIVMRPVYRDPESEQAFPLIQRALHRGLGRAVRRTVFTFTRDRTTQRPPHFHALGPRSLVKLVWKVDTELAEIAADFDFLLSVTPVNAERAWAAFRRQGFVRMPTFIYRPLPVDPALVKRQLYRIPIEKIEDPALEALFRAQQLELERKLTMLSDRGNPRFLYGSLQLYGKVEDDLLEDARAILDSIPARRRGRPGGGKISASAFAERAETEIQFYRAQDARVWSRVELRDDVVGVLVSHGNLLVNRQQKFDENRVDALLAHEIGTHVLTFFNGQAQPFRQLYCGLPDYEELQEGLAVLAEYLTGGLTPPRLRLLAARVVAAHMLTEGAEFPEVFAALHDRHGFAQRTAFNISLRIFRGGGLLKDMVYLRGLKRLLGYLGDGGELDPLLLGKFGADHLPIIRELQWRKVLCEPPLRPRYLADDAARERLAPVRQGISLAELAKRIH